MTINLPPDVESSIQDAVHRGHFASVDAAMTEAASMLLQRLEQKSSNAGNDLGSIGAMREDAEFLDEIVESAMKARREQPWRISPGE
jgi:Arc/MetJ-type ribon-helix-helix transcriptional regulator